MDNTKEKTKIKSMAILSLVATFVIIFYQIIAMPGMIQTLISILGLGIGGMGGYAIASNKHLPTQKTNIKL